MLDVTGLADVAIGDPVTLMGTDSGTTISAGDIAAWADTIPYDIICRVSPRVPRIYIKDGKVTGVRNRLNNHES